jgi:hypothetical protein
MGLGMSEKASPHVFENFRAFVENLENSPWGIRLSLVGWESEMQLCMNVMGWDGM